MFWKNEEWLKKCETMSPDLYSAVKNGRDFEMVWKPLSLMIDGIIYELTFVDEDGNESEK